MRGFRFVEKMCFCILHPKKYMKIKDTLKGSVIVKWKFAGNGINRHYFGIRFGRENETLEDINKKHVDTEEKEDVLLSALEIEDAPLEFQRKRIIDLLYDHHWNWLPEDSDTFESDTDALFCGNKPIDTKNHG